MGVSALAAAEASEVFEDFGVEDGGADFVDTHGPLAEVDLAAAVRAEGEVLVFDSNEHTAGGAVVELYGFFLWRHRTISFYSGSTLQRAGEDAGDYVVLVGFCDLGAVEAAGFQGGQVAEVVDVDFAVDFGGVELGTAFPEERGLFAFTFGEKDQLAADPLLLGAPGDGLLKLHEAALAGFDGAFGDLGVE